MTHSTRVSLRHAALALLCAAAIPMASSPREPASARAAGPERPETRAVLFHGGTFHTAFDLQGAEGEAGPKVEAVLAQGGRIVALGKLADLSRSETGRGATRVDIGGAHAFPGFQDAHGHVEAYGAFLEDVDLVGSESYAEVVRRVRARAAELPAGHWVLGRGWDQSLWPGGRFPEHAALSAAVPDHPVLVERVDGHAALANAAALALAGLADGELPTDPAGGAILRDGTGRATGVLVDAAMDLVQRHVPDPTEEVRRRRILRAQDALLATGLTCVHDMGQDRAVTRIYRALQESGELRLRVVGYVFANDFGSERDLEGLPTTPDFGEVYVVAGTKLMVDGALGSRGAALFDDYADAPGERGHSRLDIGRLSKLVVWSARAGLQPATHAIGDRANRMALDAYARAASDVDGFASLRPRIEHAQLVSPSDIKRFGELQVVPSMQPTHATSDMRWVVARIGDQRALTAYAWRSLAAATPVPLAFGSDFPVERPHPLEGLHAALTRQDAQGAPDGGFFPRERIGAAAALAAFTSGAAFAAGQDESRGRIALGYGCDLTVVDTDLSRLDKSRARAALDAKILMTIVNGEVLYRAEQR